MDTATPLPGLPQGGVDQRSPVEAKIALFRSLFRGREDIYPHRFESRKTGKAGYSPACGNEGVRGVCEKPRIKCSECPHQRFLPVTDAVIRWHLSGQDNDGRPFVMGVYPMLLDETCFPWPWISTNQRGRTMPGEISRETRTGDGRKPAAPVWSWRKSSIIIR